MLPQLQEALERLAPAVDAAHLESAARLQLAAWRCEAVPRLPVLYLGAQPPGWPLFPYREAAADPEKMLANELQQVYAGAVLRDDRVLAVRAGFGSDTMASLFQPRLRWMDDQFPVVERLGSRDEVRRLIDAGPPPETAGLGRRVLEYERRYREALGALGRHVRLFACDTQSPFNTALLLWGPDMYMAMRDEPDLVHALLALTAEATIRFTRAQKAVIGEPLDEAHHFQYRVPGGVRLVDDSSINVSDAMYAEFVQPYHQRVLDAFGGGYMHYCGHKLHMQARRLATRGLRGIEMGFDNPERSPSYRLEPIWSEARASRVAIVWIRENLPETRPAADTGLIYGLRAGARRWEEAPAQLDRLRELFSQGAKQHV